MNTRNKNSRRPVVSKIMTSASKSNCVDFASSSTTSRSDLSQQGQDTETRTIEGALDDFKVNVPTWISKISKNTDKVSKLTQLYTTFMGLHRFQQRNLLCDVNIRVGDTVFHAHRAVLAASSKFFHVMFTSGFQESQESDVSITGKSEAFKTILNYIYSYEMALTEETVMDVLEMAHYLQLDFVMQKCEEFLIDMIDEFYNDVFSDLVSVMKTAVSSLATAKLYGLDKLAIAAKLFIVYHFVPTEYFLDVMTGESLQEILSRSDLKDEKQVFDTTLAWLQHDWKNRKRFASPLLHKIRLGLVPLGHLSKTILKYPKLYTIKDCRELIDKALELYDACKAGDATIQSVEPNLFASRTMINGIFGFDTKHGYYYDTDNAAWVRLPRFPFLGVKDNQINGDTFGDTSCLGTDGHLYVSRGTPSVPKKLEYPRFLRLDLSHEIWIPLKPMIYRRQNARLVPTTGKIYAIGGNVEYYSQEFSCEVYDVNTRKWQLLPSIDSDDGICRPAMESCQVYHDKLLVYGGCSIFGRGADPERHLLKMYDPTNNCWTTLMDDTHTGQHNAILGLVINDDRCYRIFCCKCLKDKDCQKKSINVEEIVIDFESKTAHIGERQNQDLITRGSTSTAERRMGFRVNEDVYGIHKQQFFKTEIKISDNRTDPIDLGCWKNLCTSQRSRLLAQFKFDIEKWRK